MKKIEDEHDELQNGKRLAAEIVEHLVRMGASRMETPVFRKDEKFVVRVEHLPVDPVDPED
jgi:hypothetical protein